MAYGVVSGAMTKYGEVKFDVRSIFNNIFYAPYWFLYSEASDEKKALDSEIIQSIKILSCAFILDMVTGNTSSSLVTEAIATHVLLAFHMLFINILLLNLLIALFAYVL